MAEKRTHGEVGEVGRQVGENIQRIRSSRRYPDGKRLTTARLAEAVSSYGVPMSASTITKIEQGRRRTTVEELVTLAVALDVSPVTLMLPEENPGEPVPITGEVKVPWEVAWRWMHGEITLTSTDADAYSLDWVMTNRPYEGTELSEVERFLQRRAHTPFSMKVESDGTTIKGEMTTRSGASGDAD